MIAILSLVSSRCFSAYSAMEESKQLLSDVEDILSRPGPIEEERCKCL